MLEGEILKAGNVLEQSAVMVLPRRLTSLWSRARLFSCAVPWTCSCSILRSTASSCWLRTPSAPVSKCLISFWWAIRKRSREPSCSPFGYSGGVDKVSGAFRSVVLNVSPTTNQREKQNQSFFIKLYLLLFFSTVLQGLSHTRRLLASPLW